MADEAIESTLFIARETHLYRVPPRRAEGYRSGTWLVGDRIFTGRLHLVAIGSLLQVRVEDPNTGALFCTCPVPYGKRSICIEPAIDSSRYFVLKVEDPSSGRHAFLGMGFEQRSDSFDFSEALQRHEKHVQHELAAEIVHAHGDASASGHAGCTAASAAAGKGSFGSDGEAAGLADAVKEMESLYRSQDLSLKEGETIKVAVRKERGKAGLLSGDKPLIPLPLPLPGQAKVGAGVLPPPPGLFAVLAPPPSYTSSSSTATTTSPALMGGSQPAAAQGSMHGLPGNPGSATANSTVLDLLDDFDSLALCTSNPAPSSTPYSTQPPMASSTQAAAAAPSSLPPSFSDSLWDEMAVPGVGQVVVPASGQPAAPAAASQGWATFD